MWRWITRTKKTFKSVLETLILMIQSTSNCPTWPRRTILISRTRNCVPTSHRYDIIIRPYQDKDITDSKDTWEHAHSDQSEAAATNTTPNETTFILEDGSKTSFWKWVINCLTSSDGKWINRRIMIMIENDFNK